MKPNLAQKAKSLAVLEIQRSYLQLVIRYAFGTKAKLISTNGRYNFAIKVKDGFKFNSSQEHTVKGINQGGYEGRTPLIKTMKSKSTNLRVKARFGRTDRFQDPVENWPISWEVYDGKSLVGQMTWNKENPSAALKAFEEMTADDIIARL